MKCPHCGTNIPVLQILTAKKDMVTCGACKRKLRVKGLMATLIWFLILSVFFGFPYPNNLLTLLAIGFVESVAAYSILFLIIVELATIEDTEKLQKS
jgi:hypothetical protein